jgi:hypothetical protein
MYNKKELTITEENLLTAIMIMQGEKHKFLCQNRDIPLTAEKLSEFVLTDVNELFESYCRISHEVERLRFQLSLCD